MVDSQQGSRKFSLYKMPKHAICALMSHSAQCRPHIGEPMRQPKKRANSAAAHGSPKIRMQPNYHSEISDRYIDAMQRAVDEKKPEGFRLTPIGEAGW